jgi:hypothetical protein
MGITSDSLALNNQHSLYFQFIYDKGIKMNVIKSTLSVAIGLALSTVVAANHTDHKSYADGELSHIEGVVNSDTMKAASKMCAVTVGQAHKEKAIGDLALVKLVSHCAIGNIAHVVSKLGGAINEQEDGLYSIVTNDESGVVRHFSVWEMGAISTASRVEKDLKEIVKK